MSDDLSNPIFHDEGAARAHMEAIRWPNGPFCPHCGSVEGVSRLQGKSHRPGLHQCNACRGHFTVTNGTVMERSHVPLHKWVLGFHLMAASKKGVSAHQLHRMLDVTYKTAWFMSHRIREAMRDPNPSPLGGEGEVVEGDEAYHGKKETPTSSPHRRGRPYIKKGKAAQKRTVVALVERGGEARAFHVQQVTAKGVRDILVRNADRKSRLHTDESNLGGFKGSSRHDVC
jgi:transposase-like protein